MGINHDPGPAGASGEGETVLVCICLSYFLAACWIFLKYKQSSTHEQLNSSTIQSDHIELEPIEAPQVNVTEEVYVNDNLHKDELTLKLWEISESYNPSNEYRKNFIYYSSFGFVKDGDFIDIDNNTTCFKVLYYLSGVDWTRISLFIFVWGLIWLFLVCLGMMGNGFKLLGGKDAAKMFDVVDNPISGLMIGILTTVLVQSSSTTTSIIIGLVGADEMSVNTAIPMIMGANIGTSVTNTLVSFSHFADTDELRRGFAGATIHDCFNFLTVLILLPIQWITQFFNHMTYEMAKDFKACDENNENCDKQEFIKPYIKPYYNDIAKYDKKVANYVSQGYCDGRCKDNVDVELRKNLTHTICNNDYLIFNDCDDIKSFRKSWLDSDNVLKNTRLPGFIQIINATNTTSIVEYLFDCPSALNCDNVTHYWSDTNINRNALLAIENPNDHIGELFKVCENMEYNLCDKRLLKGGIFYRDWHLSDSTAGALCVVFSLSGICTVLYLIVQSLNILVKGTVAKWLKKAVSFNGYASILLGMFLTIMVQSSSITTSVLTPLVAIGLIPLKDMYPLTLGANIGTTITGILAASVVTSNPVSAWQVALTHLLFNIFGIMIWYPFEKARQVPIRMALYLGDMTTKNKYFPIIYISTTFFALPGIVYGISTLIEN